jgi:uncharacterized protein (DUF433 family)
MEQNATQEKDPRLNLVGLVEGLENVHGGALRFTGTRLPVATLFGNMADGMSLQQVCEEYGLSEETCRQVLVAAQHWFFHQVPDELFPDGKYSENPTTLQGW